MIDRNKMVHPHRMMKPEWFKNTLSLCEGELIVSHCIEPPDTIKLPPTSHHTVMVQFNRGTRQITRLNGQEYDGEMQPGEFLLHPASIEGFYHWETTDEALMFVIEPSFLTKVAVETECINPNKIEVRNLVKSYCPHLERIAYDFLREMYTGGVGSKLYSDYLANLMAINLLRYQCTFKAKLEEIKGGLSPRHRQQAIDYIQAHLSEQLSLQALSALVGLSQAHFCREFKKSVGLAPHKYVMQQRIEMAKRLLKQQQDLAIAEIATDCGFTHQSHMGKIFKEHTGVTPRQYRKQFET